MSRKKVQHTKQIKLDTVAYRKEQPDLTQVKCAKNLSIGICTLARLESQLRDNNNDIPVRGLVTTNLMKQKKSPTSNENPVMPRTLLMCKQAIGILGKD